MRIPFLSLVVVLTAMATAHADLLIVQKVEGTGGLEGEMTVRIKGARARADLVNAISMIFDGGSGETLVLQHRQRNFGRISSGATKAIAEQLQKAKESGDPPKLTATGETKPIAGHPTEAFLWTVGQLKVHFWVSKDFPNGAAIQQQLEEFQKSGLAAATAALMPTAEQLPGVRLRTELELAGQKTATTITSLKEEPVDDAVFQVPPDYREVILPVNSAGQPPPK